MAAFDVLATTVRDGLAVDAIEVLVADGPPTIGYLLGRSNQGPQPLAIGLHDERGDKATLLPDLEHLASRGFLCIAIDSPVTRRASAERNPLQAFDSQFAIAMAALAVAEADPEIHDGRVALLGRGLGAEVAAYMATHSSNVRVVAAMAALPDRSEFLRSSPHPLAAGLRQFNDDAEVARQVSELRPRRLIHQLETATNTHWLLQIPEDDDRFSDSDHATMSLSIPRTVRVEYVAHARDLASVQARRTRVDFISSLCG